MDVGYVSSNGSGPDVMTFPMGICSAPVTWIRMGEVINMKFLSGFVGYCQDSESLEICPNIAWCIAYCNDGASKKTN